MMHVHRVRVKKLCLFFAFSASLAAVSSWRGSVMDCGGFSAGCGAGGRSVGKDSWTEGVSSTIGVEDAEGALTSGAGPLASIGAFSLSTGLSSTCGETVGRIYGSLRPKGLDGSGKGTTSLIGDTSDEVTEFSGLAELLACDFARAFRRCRFSVRASFLAFLIADLEGFASGEELEIVVSWEPGSDSENSDDTYVSETGPTSSTISSSLSSPESIARASNDVLEATVTDPPASLLMMED
jgi:hypothetical protein